MLVELVIDDVPYRVHLSRDGQAVKGDVDGHAFAAKVRPLEGTRFEVIVDGQAVEVDVATDRSARVGHHAVQFRLLGFSAVGEDAAGGARDGVLRPPMPGAIARLMVKEGDRVEKGRPMVVLEAMKMQNEIVAPFAGTVRKVHVKAGDTVTLKDVVLELEGSEANA